MWEPPSASIQLQQEAFYSWFIVIPLLFKLSFMSKVFSCLQITGKQSLWPHRGALSPFLGFSPLITCNVGHQVKKQRNGLLG